MPAVITIFVVWVMALIVFALLYNDIFISIQDWIARIFSLGIMIAAFIFYVVIHGGFWSYLFIFPLSAVSLAWLNGKLGGTGMIMIGIIGSFGLTSINRLTNPEIVPAYVIVPLYLISGILHIIICCRQK